MNDIAPASPRRRLLPAFLVFALAAATIALGVTGAVFTDSASSADNSFATGNVTLTLGTASTLPFSVTNMTPGDTAGAEDVVVENSGSLEYRYAITSTTSSTTTNDHLASQLDLWVWEESAEDDTLLSGTAGTCDATPGTGISTYLYGPGILGSTTTTDLVGDPAQGSHTGDRILAAGGSEVLCFFVELPSTSDNQYEDEDTSADFAFEAEQTTNN